jgi:recombinase-like zinc beta ribbon protein
VGQVPESCNSRGAIFFSSLAAYKLCCKEYGIRWWNRYSRRSRQVSEPTRDGSRRYRRKVALSERDRAEWVATPVPALLPREPVEVARSAIASPRPQERKDLTRGWELKGLMRCPSCGGAMTPHTAKRDEKRYHYYRCHRGAEYRRGSCEQRMKRAKEAEEAMWGFVSRIMKDPGRILVGMDALIEQKRSEMRGDPELEAKAWLERLAEVDQERRGYLRLAATGRMSEADLDVALAELEETRQTAERELDAVGVGGRR